MDSIWDSHATESGGRYRRRGTGYICGVLPMGVEMGGMFGRQVTKKGKQPRKNLRTLHVLSLEVEGGNPTGGPEATPMV